MTKAKKAITRLPLAPMIKCSKCAKMKHKQDFSHEGKLPKGLSKRCNACFTNKKVIVKTLRSKDRCISCDRFKLKNSGYCLYHWAYSLICGNNSNKDVIFYRENMEKRTRLLLGKLSNQNFKCAYTGIPLIPGINASLDHKKAYSKSRDDSIDNLVWVDTLLNRHKGTGDKEAAIEKFNFYIKAIQTNEYPIYQKD